MKKIFINVALVLSILGASTVMPSCIGSFNLTNRLLTWNRSIDNKFVNELVFVAFWILPVYEVSGLADLLVLNSIEFWSGKNAVAQGTSVIESDHGRYLVDCDGHGYTVTAPDGVSYRLDFNEQTREWSMPDANGNRVVFLQYIDDNTVRVPAVDGAGMTTVTLDRASVLAYRQSATAQTLALR